MKKCPDCSFQPLHQSGIGLWCPKCEEYKSEQEKSIWESLLALIDRCKCYQEKPCEVCIVDEVRILIEERTGKR